MIWHVRIHKLVLDEDFEKTSQSVKKLILKTIKKKLTIDPEAYGKPLLGPFKGLWRLRIGEYRAVYRVIKNDIIVLVIKVGARKNDSVYIELIKRLEKLK